MEEHSCIQEARISAIETKLENKKENLDGLHGDYYHLRDKIELLSEHVVEITTLLKENRKKEDLNNKKIDELQVEIAKTNLEINRMSSSMDTIKYVIGVGVPFACAIITVIGHIL